MWALSSEKKILDESFNKTAESNHELGITQIEFGDHTSATESFNRAFNNKQKLLGE